MPEADVFSERLKNAREMRKLTQGGPGQRANPSTSIAHFEAGSRKPSFDNLRKLAAALEVTTDYLLGRVEEPAMEKAGDVLFRDLGKLPAYDREIAAGFLKMPVDLDGESGNTIWICLQYETKRGKTGPFGPILKAVIP
jgi:transcriptional regulator with XRE-family HTH domain